MDKNNYTWEDIKEAESGTIFHDEFKDGLRFIVMRGPASLCAYIGLPTEHPLANHDYDNVPIDCHGGLTFSQLGDGKNWPSGFYWYGWDYAHSGDYSFYDDDFIGTRLESKDKKWLVKEVIDDSWGAIYDMKRLCKLAEDIKGA